MRITEFAPDSDLQEVVNRNILQTGWTQRVHRGGLDLVAIADESGISISALDAGGREIGNAHFSVVDDHLESFDTWVRPECRRQGVATVMYNWAEELGNDLEPSSQQTPAGKRLWKTRSKKSRVIDENKALTPAQFWIKRIYDQYPNWPYGQADKVMVWGEGDDQTFAAFKLKPGTRPDVVEIDWIMAGPEQRKGVGSRAIKELQRQAAEDGIHLSLYPWDKGNVSQRSLTTLYKRHGFTPVAKGSKSMIWKSKQPELKKNR